MTSRAIWICRSEEHTSELQSLRHLVCRLLLEKNKNHIKLNHLSSPVPPQLVSPLLSAPPPSGLLLRSPQLRCVELGFFFFFFLKHRPPPSSPLPPPPPLLLS